MTISRRKGAADSKRRFGNKISSKLALNIDYVGSLLLNPLFIIMDDNE